MIPLFALAMGALFTVVLGVPLATKLAQVHVWRRTALPVGDRDSVEYERLFPFEPLDLGPDTMQWPSEVTRESHAMPLARWPSESWDDAHFGKGAPIEVAEAPPASARPKPKQAQKTSARKAAKSKLARSKPVPKPQPSARPKPPRPAPTSSGDDGLPQRAAVEAMIAELGLAGTVQALMRSQQWDFKQAASWLARIRKGG